MNDIMIDDRKHAPHRERRRRPRPDGQLGDVLDRLWDRHRRRHEGTSGAGSEEATSDR